MQFPWLMCAVFGCWLQLGNKPPVEWWNSYQPKMGLFGGKYSVVVNRPCVETIPAEKVETKIRYAEE